MFLSKYGAARHIYIPVIKRAVVDFAVSADWTPAAGDVKISKDGAAPANVTNLPTAITMGNAAMWDFSLTATEMQAAQVMVTVADAATKAVEDTMFIIETYGNASAQHPVDLADSVRAGLTALPNVAAGANGGLPLGDANARVDVSKVLGAAINALISGRVDANAQVVGDKTSYTLSAAGVQAIWDALTSALTTVGSIGKRLADFITGDAFVRLGAPAGASVSADIAALPTATANADALLKRDMGAVSGEAARSPLNAFRFLRNKWTLAAGVLTVTKEDDATSAWTAAVTTDAAAVPVTGSDPA